MGLSEYFKWAEVKERDDIDVWEGTTKWGNHDIYPVPKKERNYGYMGLYAYYALSCSKSQVFFFFRNSSETKICTQLLASSFDHRCCMSKLTFASVHFWFHRRKFICLSRTWDLGNDRGNNHRLLHCIFQLLPRIPSWDRQRPRLHDCFEGSFRSQRSYSTYSQCNCSLCHLCKHSFLVIWSFANMIQGRNSSILWFVSQEH